MLNFVKMYVEGENEILHSPIINITHLEDAQYIDKYGGSKNE